MKFFLDTANIQQIKEGYELGIIDGVTTNPSLMAREGVSGQENIRRHYEEICHIVDGDVSAEVLSTDYEYMIEEGRELSTINSNIVVKIPCTADGIRAIKELSGEGIRINCTLVFSVGQALVAAKAGATYVSPFVGRLDDISEDGVGLVHDIVKMFDYYGFATMVLAASIRSTGHIIKCMEARADVVTSPLNAITGLLIHPLTQQGLETFMRDSSALIE